MHWFCPISHFPFHCSWAFWWSLVWFGPIQIVTRAWLGNATRNGTWPIFLHKTLWFEYICMKYPDLNISAWQKKFCGKRSSHKSRYIHLWTYTVFHCSCQDIELEHPRCESSTWHIWVMTRPLHTFTVSSWLVLGLSCRGRWVSFSLKIAKISTEFLSRLSCMQFIGSIIWPAFSTFDEHCSSRSCLQ